MHTVLIYAGGRRVDALLLSVSPDRLRAVIAGSSDAVEYQLVEGRWTAEGGTPVEIGALMLSDGMDVTRFLPMAQPRTFAAV